MPFFSAFLFFKKLHTVFYGDWTNLHSCQQSQWITFLHIFANTYLFDKSHSNRDEIILFVALIWISLVIHDVETFSYISQPFVWLLWKNVYLNSLPIYKSDFFFFFFFLRLDVWVQYIYLGINPLSDIWLANIFSHSVCCLSILLIFFCCVEAIQFDVVC